MSKSKLNTFDIEHQYQLYLAKVGLTEDKMPEQQKVQLRRTFYAATGQLLLVFRDDLTALPEPKAVRTMQEMINQVHYFFEAEVAKQNSKQQ